MQKKTTKRNNWKTCEHYCLLYKINLFWANLIACNLKTCITKWTCFLYLPINRMQREISINFKLQKSQVLRILFPYAKTMENKPQLDWITEIHQVTSWFLVTKVFQKLLLKLVQGADHFRARQYYPLREIQERYLTFFKIRDWKTTQIIVLLQNKDNYPP